MTPIEILEKLHETFTSNFRSEVYEIDYENHKIIKHYLYGIIKRDTNSPSSERSHFVNYAVIEGDYYTTNHREIEITKLFKTEEEAKRAHNDWIESEKNKLESQKIII